MRLLPCQELAGNRYSKRSKIALPFIQCGIIVSTLSQKWLNRWFFASKKSGAAFNSIKYFFFVHLTERFYQSIGSLVTYRSDSEHVSEFTLNQRWSYNWTSFDNRAHWQAQAQTKVSRIQRRYLVLTTWIVAVRDRTGVECHGYNRNEYVNHNASVDRPQPGKPRTTICVMMSMFVSRCRIDVSIYADT
jgi:hypothetical protein